MIFRAVHKPRLRKTRNFPEIVRLIGTNHSIDPLSARPDNPRSAFMASHFSIPAAPSLVRRLAAMLYDGLLLVALWFVVTALLLGVSGGHLADPDRPLWLLNTLRACLLLVTFLFFAGFWTQGGQTLGMRAWRLQLTGASGGPVSWKQALWRFAAALPSVGALGLGLFWLLLDREHRALHDRLSGTRLVLLAKKP